MANSKMSWRSLLLIIFCFSTKAHSQNYRANIWADSVMSTMSLDEKLDSCLLYVRFQIKTNNKFKMLVY